MFRRHYRGIQCAEKAVEDDNAHNYEAAAKEYLAAVEHFLHAGKYGIMSENTKKTIRAKIESYLKRAEELQNIVKHGPVKKKELADDNRDRRNSKDNKDDDNEISDPERKQLMQKFEGAIITDPKITFDDVVGLEQAKEALKEAIILPVKFPQLFHGKRKPWAGILLYGPPGTGKTYLANAVATECKSTFICVNSSDLLSKWLG
ncbi:unnamed protein product, partial [Rotaria sp. Silwood1]